MRPAPEIGECFRSRDRRVDVAANAAQRVFSVSPVAEAANGGRSPNPRHFSFRSSVECHDDDHGQAVENAVDSIGCLKACVRWESHGMNSTLPAIARRLSVIGSEARRRA